MKLALGPRVETYAPREKFQVCWFPPLRLISLGVFPLPANWNTPKGERYPYPRANREGEDSIPPRGTLPGCYVASSYSSFWMYVRTALYGDDVYFKQISQNSSQFSKQQLCAIDSIFIVTTRAAIIKPAFVIVS